MLNLINGNTRKVPQSPEAETLWRGKGSRLFMDVEENKLITLVQIY